MYKSFYLLLAIFVLLSSAITAGAVEKKAAETNPAKAVHDITIFFSNDALGETEPCG